MYGRWVNLGVLVLWLATMTWLVTAKVVPALLIGNPPSTEKVLAARAEEPLVGWNLRCDGRSIGWALSLTRTTPEKSTEIVSRVHFEKLPIYKLTPGWLRSLFSVLDKQPLQVEADAETSLLIDSSGQLESMASSVRFQPLGEEITMTGTVDGTRIKLVVRCQDLNYKTDIPIHEDALYGEALSPQTHLPNLHQGQTWPVEVCSPLGYPNHSVEVLQAEVVGRDRLFWEDKWEPIWLVEYRNTPGFRLSTAGRARGRLWVRLDGTVLIQEVNLLNVKMRFVRMSAEEARKLADEQGLAAR